MQKACPSCQAARRLRIALFGTWLSVPVVVALGVLVGVSLWQAAYPPSPEVRVVQLPPAASEREKGPPPPGTRADRENSEAMVISRNGRFWRITPETQQTFRTEQHFEAFKIEQVLAMADTLAELSPNGVLYIDDKYRWRTSEKEVGQRHIAVRRPQGNLARYPALRIIESAIDEFVAAEDLERMKNLRAGPGQKDA
jgi:hypothetical protein